MLIGWAGVEVWLVRTSLSIGPKAEILFFSPLVDSMYSLMLKNHSCYMVLPGIGKVFMTTPSEA